MSYYLEYVKDRTNRLFSFAFGLIISLSQAIGKEVYTTHSLRGVFGSGGNVWITVMRILVCSFAWGLLGLLACEALSKIPRIKKKPDNLEWYTYIILFVISWLVFLISFSLAYQAYYPGNAAYDYLTQVYYYFGVLPFSKHHPPLHSLYLFETIKFATNHGLYAETVYAMSQMIMLSFILACCVTYLLRLHVNAYWVFISILFVAFYPAIAIFSITTTKDTLFAAFFFAYTLLTTRLCNNPEEALASTLYKIAFIVVTLLCCLMRNNAVYAIVLSTSSFLIMPRVWRRKTLMLLSASLILFVIIDRGLYSGIMNIEEGESAEKLSVPIQQISTVVYYCAEELTEEQISYVKRYIPIELVREKYNPRFVDEIKNEFDSERYDKNKLLFWKGWLSLFRAYPDYYISGFLDLNIPYWYIGSNTIDSYSKRDYIEVGHLHSDASTSRLPKLLKKYEDFASYKIAEEKPYLKTLMSITTPFFVMLICTFSMLISRRYRLLPAMCPSLLLWFTIVAGPVSNFRYVFPFVLMYPYYFMLIFNSFKEVE